MLPKVCKTVIPVRKVNTGGERRLILRPARTWGFAHSGWVISVFSAQIYTVLRINSRFGMSDLSLFYLRVGIFLLNVENS